MNSMLCKSDVAVDDLQTGAREFIAAIEESADVDDNKYAAYLAVNRVKNTCKPA
jgi:hypothetical protein